MPMEKGKATSMIFSGNCAAKANSSCRNALCSTSIVTQELFHFLSRFWGTEMFSSMRLLKFPLFRNGSSS